jgi:hypothetical protein
MKTTGMLLALTGALLMSTAANATLRIAFQNGVSTFGCADQTACDLNGAVKNLLLLNTTVGDIKIVGTFAASTTGPDTLSVSNLTITNMSTSKTETLNMAMGDTGFLGIVSGIRSSASLTFNHDNGGSGALSFWADHLDGQPGLTAFDLPGVNLFSTSQNVSTSPDSFSGTKDTAFFSSGLFSMAEGAALTLKPGASITGFNESMAASAIPETKTWAMLGIGFGLMAIMGVRRRRDSRWLAA